MSSLGRHLTTPAPHGELPFHPSCPTCRHTRLHGSIPDGPIVPARVKASLATALVTVSTAGAAPGTSVAQEIDEQVEGTELPQPKPERAPDPGDETRVADDESIPVPGVDGGDTEDNSEGAALESEPETVPPPPEGAGAPTPSPPDDMEVPAPLVPTPEVALPAPAPPADAVKGEAEEPRSPLPGRRAEADPAPPQAVAAPPLGPSLAAPSLEAPRSLPTGGEDPPASSQEWQPSTARSHANHTVRPGESLWSIAAGLAGDDASPAKIARIVNRLWSLNADRIGTGDPDLVMVGTTLRLP